MDNNSDDPEGQSRLPYLALLATSVSLMGVTSQNSAARIDLSGVRKAIDSAVDPLRSHSDLAVLPGLTEASGLRFPVDVYEVKGQSSHQVVAVPWKLSAKVGIDKMYLVVGKDARGKTRITPCARITLPTPHVADLGFTVQLQLATNSHVMASSLKPYKLTNAQAVATSKGQATYMCSGEPILGTDHDALSPFMARDGKTGTFSFLLTNTRYPFDSGHQVFGPSFEMSKDIWQGPTNSLNYKTIEASGDLSF